LVSEDLAALVALGVGIDRDDLGLGRRLSQDDRRTPVIAADLDDARGRRQARGALIEKPCLLSGQPAADSLDRTKGVIEAQRTSPAKPRDSRSSTITSEGD
jgi:hypothetical protein